MTRYANLSLLAILLVAPLAARTPKTAKRPVAAKAGKARHPQEGPAMITTPSGLQYIESAEGVGECPLPGQTCVVHYTGWLSEGGAKGKKFDSSVDRGEPLSFPVGTGRVIKGWDEGLLTMKKGGKRTLTIPPELGYGTRGAGGGVIPANAVLIFDVELLDFK